MDEAHRIVSELQAKLAELDQKVSQYRRAMATEFTKYSEDVLRDTPATIAEDVRKTMAAEMSKYPSLNPVESPKAGTSSVPQATSEADAPYFTESAAPKAVPKSVGGVDSPVRSPHEREFEFQGVFTPTYLPLLDSTSPKERRRAYSPLSPTLDKGKSKDMEGGMGVDASTDTRSLAASPEFHRPATPRRQNTDTSVLSNSSDHSDSTVRRSALRRSSSSGKPQSPRQVRFDVEGEEVLPTSSPLPKAFEGYADSSDSDEEGGLEQIEDIDSPPPPKRISSSQALRALSRAPIEDDGTVWSTVSQNPEDTASIDRDSDEEEQHKEGLESYRSPVHGAMDVPRTNGRGYNPNAAEGAEDDDDETLSDDDAMLDMQPLRRAHKAESVSILSPVPDQDVISNTPVPRSPSKPWSMENFISEQGGENGDLRFNDDQDELFHFDGENANDQRSPPEPEDEPESPTSPDADEEDKLPTPKVDFDDIPRSLPRSTPGRYIPKPEDTTVRGVVGSYKGRPFGMPIVSDEIHAQAAAMGPVSSFVGSLHGRSGMDESDVQSYRESFKAGVGSFHGEPKSFTERMMMDELREEEENKQTAKTKIQVPDVKENKAPKS